MIEMMMMSCKEIDCCVMNCTLHTDSKFCRASHMVGEMLLES